MNSEIEEGKSLQLDFKKIKKIDEIEEDVIPAVVQDLESKEVLILGSVNQKSLEQTIQTKRITFWSTSRNELWVKGATSGSYLHLEECRVNCEQNSVLFLVTIQDQGACHTKGENGTYRKSCYYRKIDEQLNLDFQF